MNKQQFLDALKTKLSRFPEQEVIERLNFYSEMIDDRIEEGCPEDKAVLSLGSIDDVAKQIVSEIPLSTILKEKIKFKRRLKTWEITLLAIGSPIWLSLLIAVASIIFSLYLSLCSVVISFWATFVAFVASVPTCLIGTICFVASGHTLSAFATVSAMLALTGLAIFFFLACKILTKFTLILPKKIAFAFKNSHKKERA